MLSVLLLIGLVMTINPLIDFYQIKAGIWINHTTHAIIAGALYVLTLLVSGWLGVIEEKQAFAIAVAIPAARWLVHDFLLYLLLDRPLDYLPEPSPRASRIDMILIRVRNFGISPLIVKTIFLVFSLGISTMIYHEKIFGEFV